MVTDPFVAMTVAATVTEGVEIGSAILQLPLYQSADLAHRVLSLQQVCGDRLLLGVGAGSTANDFAAFGRSFEARFRDFTTTLADLRAFVLEREIPVTGSRAAEVGDLALHPQSRQAVLD